MGYYSRVMIATTEKGFEKIKRDQKKFKEENLLDCFEIKQYEKNGRSCVFLDTIDTIKYYTEYEDIEQLEKTLSKLKDGYMFCRIGEENGDLEIRNRTKISELYEEFDFLFGMKNYLNKELGNIEEEEEFE